MYPILIGTSVFLIIISITYRHIGLDKVKQCYGMWMDKKYWVNYNIVEAVSWLAKAIIIVPGLIFGIKIWWLYFIPLTTSVLLIWASEKKLLPTLVGFNTLWVWIACVALAQSLM
jgi:hypothetical protein